nr:unnamed protein product [Callosobruchus chinensis]
MRLPSIALQVQTFIKRTTGPERTRIGCKKSSTSLGRTADFINFRHGIPAKWLPSSPCGQCSGLLDVSYPGRWIGIIPRPLRSEELDFYRPGRVRDLVFANRPTTRNNMIKQVRDSCQLFQLPNKRLQFYLLVAYR